MKALLDSLVEVIINTRDFCGNEREAAIDYLADEGIRGDEAATLYRKANYKANGQWNKYKRLAGVNEKHLF